ncbi:MAG: tRNA adenosine(34) deaminase TadA [Gammaproteobacteria bacterium]|nr:tRNA adenosine(34) deaminase TadA [Gammaproteobacteria bacterium]
MGVTEHAATDTDAVYMAQALALAREAEAAGEVPVGALLVLNGVVIARARNAPIASNDPTAHAEIQALRAAGTALGNYRLPGSVVYVTLEPCPMCAGAMVHARVERLVFGVADPRSGAAGSVIDLVRSPDLNHRLAVTGGVLEAECRDLLQQFFRDRR